MLLRWDASPDLSGGPIAACLIRIDDVSGCPRKRRRVFACEYRAISGAASIASGGKMKKWHLAGGATIAATLLVGAANAAETITYTYDAKGRLIKVERTGTVNNGVKSEYTHDKADNRTNAKVTGSTNPPPP